MPPISSALSSGADSQDGGAVGPYLTQALRGLECRKRDSHIDPPTSANAIMQEGSSPYCGEDSDPGRRIKGELDMRSR